MKKSTLFKRGSVLVSLTFIPEVLLIMGIEFNPLLFQSFQFISCVPLIIFIIRLIKSGRQNINKTNEKQQNGSYE